MDPTLVSWINVFVIGVLGSLLVGALFKWLGPRVAQLVVDIKSQMGPEQWKLLTQVAATGVKYAEQTGLMKTGQDKFGTAMSYIQASLKNTALEGLDISVLVGAIEAAVHEMNTSLVTILADEKPEDKVTN